MDKEELTNTDIVINSFIKKWCSDNAPHLLDSDDNDGERLRQSINLLLKQECQRLCIEAKESVWKSILGDELKILSDDWITIPVDFIKRELESLKVNKTGEQVDLNAKEVNSESLKQSKEQKV